MVRPARLRGEPMINTASPSPYPVARPRACYLPYNSFTQSISAICTGLIHPLAMMTRYDYYMTMTGIRIADLKSRLSEHLRMVRAGSSLTILDRDTPIARIVPWKAGNGSLKLRAPLPGAPKLQRVPLPPPLRLRGDVVKLLMEERQGDR